MHTISCNSKEERKGAIEGNKRSKKDKGYLHKENVKLDEEGRGIDTM